MNWIIASIIMFFTSVVLYLFVRKSNLLKTPQQLTNLAMFLIPIFPYLILAANSDVRFELNLLESILIIISAIFFSYLGNVFSLKGIQKSPNPGYSLIISKSYVVFTSIVSIFLFNAPLTITSVIAIFLIVGFSALIMIDKNKNQVSTEYNKSWLPYTIGAFFCWGFLALTAKYLLNIGVPVLTRLIYSMSIVVFFIFGEIIVKKVAVFKISSKQLIVLILIGISSAVFNYFMQVGFDLAPNVGFINAANAASVALLSLMSALIFKDELPLKKVIGIIGVTAGLIILFL